MVQAYNFLASWQLFPEKCDFTSGIPPKSGNYKIESIEHGHALSISINWVSMDNEAYYTQYKIIPDGQLHPFENTELADEAEASIANSSTLLFTFYKNHRIILEVKHEIMPNGYLKSDLPRRVLSNTKPSRLWKIKPICNWIKYVNRLNY